MGTPMFTSAIRAALAHPVLRAAGFIAVGLMGSCSGPPGAAPSAAPEPVATVESASTILTCTATSYALSGGAVTVTATGGTGNYSACTLGTNTSGGTCTIAGGVATYHAGATAGYYIVPQRTSGGGTYTGGTYLQSYTTGGFNYVEPGGAAGLSSLWVMAASGSGFTFQLAGQANGYMYTPPATVMTESPGNDLIANTNAAGAGIYTMADCNGSGDTGLYNRFGFVSASGTNPYWQEQNNVTPTGYIQTVNSGSGSCSQTSGGAWEAFYLLPGGDVITATDSGGNTAPCTIAVENPVAILPSTIALATGASTAAQTNGVNAVQAWGGSGSFTGATPCTVTTNVSHAPAAATCSVTGSGQVSYTAGATAGTDVLKITDSQGHSQTVNVLVGGTVVSVGFGVNPPQPVAPKQSAVLTTNGSGTYTWTILDNNSGGTIVAATGQYTAGATGNVSDLIQVTNSATSQTATVILNVGPPVTLAPSVANVQKATPTTFIASGGSGTFSTCGLTTNGSGSTGCAVTAGGSVTYTSGATAGTDVLRVTDTLGNTGTVTITVSCGADPNLQILYPYNKTVFPLGLLPPIIQWKDSGTTTTGYAKVTLQYPTTGTPIFLWSEIVSENGPLPGQYATLPTGSGLPVTGGGRASIPAIVWTTLQNAAAGSNVLISVQTLLSNQGTIPASVTVQFATAPLKGTIYYQSYDTNLLTHGAATPTGAVLGITVGAQAPTLVDGNATTCRACHSVSANGTVMVVNDNGGTDDGLYGGSNKVALPADTETAIAPGTGTTPNDGRFSWPAVSPDGGVIFTSTGGQPVWNSGQWGSTTTTYGGVASGTGVATLSSGLYSVTTGGLLTTSGLAAGFQGKFPAWATDMSALAFNYASSDNISLAMMTFTQSTATFSTPTVLFTPPTSPSGYPPNSGAAEWPSFMPAGNNGIVFQNRVAYDCQEPGADGASGGSNLGNGNNGGTGELQGSIGALGELWWVNTSGTPVASRLANANGAGYLPTGKNAHGVAGSTVANATLMCGGAACGFDSSGGYPTWAQLSSSGGCAGGCGSCQTAAYLTALGNGNDALENFKPTVNPQVTGGYQWLVFMSRRMYGNVGVLNPYASNPRTTAEIRNNATPQYPESKKLWVAAMNTTPTAGSDPSYPAFYLDGQELYAGNSRSYWVLPQCIVPSATRSTATVCTSNQDCCTTGTGTPASCTLDIPIATNPPTKHCVPNTSIVCSADGAACNVDGDCCNLASEGARCSGGLCTQPPVPYPSSLSTTYDFQGTCSGGVVIGDASQGQAPVWRYIQSDEIIPAGTSITITLQTAATEAGLATATATTAYSLGTATITAPSYLSSPQVPSGMTTVAETVDQFLRAQSPAQASQLWLRITVNLNPSSDHQSAPTLISVEPTFDCAASE
jgi:hypothetical protein